MTSQAIVQKITQQPYKLTLSTEQSYLSVNNSSTQLY